MTLTPAKLLLCLMLLGLNSAARHPQFQDKSEKEQSAFGADSGLDRPVPIPEAALKALRSALKASPDELAAQDLQVSEIHLNGQAEIDLVALGIPGAHTRPFYVLKPTSSGYDVILSSVGDAMTVLKAKSNGYRNIKVWANTFAGTKTITVIYRFDGQKYAKFRAY